MSDTYFEIFYSSIILIFWLVIPFFIIIGFFIYFNRLTNRHINLKKDIKDTKWQVKWGYRRDGSSYIKDEGWGTNYSKLSKLEYFTKLNQERNKNGKDE